MRLFPLGLLLSTLVLAQAPSTDHWVTTWATANLQPPTVRLAAVGQAVPVAQQALIGFNNQTIRMIVPVTAGGRRARVRFSNAFGTTPLQIGAAHVALHEKDSAIAAGSDHALAFGGKPGITIPPGATVMSDGVDMPLPALSHLAVSVFVPQFTGAPTVHSLGLHTTYISKTGDFTAQATIADAATTQSWYWLAGVDILAPLNTGAIVAFGDSITDGARSTPDTDNSWPSHFAKRLADSGRGNLAVVNQGIAGNRILRDVVGQNALARFDADVISQAGVRWLVILEGINDIGRATGPNANPADSVTGDELIVALKQMIERAHSHGIRVAGATPLPYQGAAYYSDKGEAMRTQVNEWIRSSGAFNAVIDFDAATRDPQNPKALRAAYDSGDHLHPNDAGYKAMADAIDLAIFGAPSGTATSASR